MNKLKDNLNYIGLGLVAAALMVLRVWPQRRALGLAALGLGLAAIVGYIALNLSSLKRGFKRKSFIYSSNMLLVVVLVLGIVGLVNYLSTKNHHRFDFTVAKLHSLSDQSVTVAKALKSDVTIQAFFREGNMSKAAVENLLKIYAYHSPRIKYTFVDPDKNPGLVKRYDVTQDGTLIFEAGDKDARTTGSSEEDLTNTLIKVTRKAKKVIYFLEGHGERSIDESGDDGYSTVKAELEKLGYEVKKASLALSETFPKDCEVLVIPGPQKDLLPNEQETIKNYVHGGGRLFFMLDPETAPGLAAFAAQFGVKADNDLIVDTVSRMLGGDYFMPVVTEYESHDITSKFRYATFFPFARSIEIAEPKPEGITLSALAKTSGNSWSERQLDDKKVKFDKGKDVQGPLTLAVVGTVKGTAAPVPAAAEAAAKPGDKPEAKPAAEAKPAEPRDGRIAVFGDSDFAENRYYNLSGNGNFFLNTVNWLAQESDLISIQPKTQTPRTIQMTPSQSRLVFLVSVLILPLAVLLAGISIWMRRRAL